jgi:hypothetical protein
MTELWAADAVIGYLAKEGWGLRSMRLPPQRHLTPDVVAVLQDGRRVGVEVTELRDPRSAKRAQAVKEGKEGEHFYRIWDNAGIQEAVYDALLCKDQKRPTWGASFDEYLVVVHTDEPLISSQPDTADAALRQMASAALRRVTRAFFLIWYVPKSAGPRPRIYEIPVLSGAGSPRDPTS